VRWPEDQSKGSTIFTYGCLTIIFAGWAAVAGYLIYAFVTRPNEMFGFLAVLGIIYAVLIPVCLAWMGLVWVMRSERKHVKQTVAFTIGTCYVVLVIAGALLILDGLLRLYRHERIYFVIVASCLGLVIFRYGARLKIKE
jgi:hypothetical protein